MNDSNEIPWKTCKIEHEGYPLMLRCPQDIPFGRQADLPRLVFMTHLLDQVTGSGLPEAEYNDSLFEFDEAAIHLLQSPSDGVTVLVETFAGKRTYYSYVSETANVDAETAKLLELFPDVRIESSVREDKNWQFIRRYAADYGI